MHPLTAGICTQIQGYLATEDTSLLHIRPPAIWSSCWFNSGLEPYTLEGQSVSVQFTQGVTTDRVHWGIIVLADYTAAHNVVLQR